MEPALGKRKKSKKRKQSGKSGAAAVAAAAASAAAARVFKKWLGKLLGKLPAAELVHRQPRVTLLSEGMCQGKQFAARSAETTGEWPHWRPLLTEALQHLEQTEQAAEHIAADLIEIKFGQTATPPVPCAAAVVEATDLGPPEEYPYQVLLLVPLSLLLLLRVSLANQPTQCKRLLYYCAVVYGP